MPTKALTLYPVDSAVNISPRASPDPEKQLNCVVIDSCESFATGEYINPILEKTVWRKMDLRLLPVVTMFYFLSFLDRSNISNARVAGLQSDLKMTNTQYSIALTVTYVPYILAELPSNLLLKIVGPNVMLATMLTLWGAVTALQGVVRNYHALLACRFFLGLFEGGMLPGLVLYMSFFYPRQKLHLRISAFFSATTLSGAFSGLLAFGIINMNGVANRPGWAWIFVLEGGFTFAFGLASYFLLPNSPSHAVFLSAKEKEYVVSKLKEDGSMGKRESDDAFSWREVTTAFKLPQVWMQAILFFLAGTSLYGMAYFTPSIVQGLGFTAERAQLMSVPPFVVAFFVTMLGSYISDRLRCRGLVSISSAILSIIGFGMFLGSEKHKIQYASLFFSIPGVYLAAPTLSAWCADNCAPQARRATAIAIGFIMTNSGGILATWLLGSLSPAPRYTLATELLLVFSVLTTVFSGLNIWYLAHQNQKKEGIRTLIPASRERSGLGDRSAWFIYSL